MGWQDRAVAKKYFCGMVLTFYALYIGDQHNDNDAKKVLFAGWTRTVSHIT
jgi:hypothetical protein